MTNRTASECRPPDETPDGTVCWLMNGMGHCVPVRWKSNAYLQFGYKEEYTPRYFRSCGYRFHSIATPPKDAK